MKLFSSSPDRDANGTDCDPDPVESLKASAAAAKLNVAKLQVGFRVGEDDHAIPGDRTEICVSDGKSGNVWHVDSLRALWRGSRQPPPDSELSHYPPEYVPFFYGIEHGLPTGARWLGRDPTDDEFLDLYMFMRKRPDGKSMGPIHDVVWQAAALVLGMRPWSEAEYTACFAQLARSARHFRMGPSSRNYIAYLRTTFAQQG